MTSPTGTVLAAEVRSYAESVRLALADVPADRAGELLEDLEEHLAEVAAEGEGSLRSRLGSPAAYAAELRAAAGLPGSAPADEGGAVLARWGEQLRSSRAVTEVVRFLPELRPAWWVVRAWAAVTAVDVFFVGGTSFPVPTLGLGPFGLVATVAAVVWSVRLGMRARAAGRPADRRAVVLNAGLAVLTLIAVVGVAGGVDAAVADPVYVDNGQPGVLSHEDGTPITNIYPYDSDGRPLTGVLLYDQDGRPIQDVAGYDAEGGTVEPLEGAAPQPANMFPQQRQVTGPGEWGPPSPMSAPASPATPSATGSSVATASAPTLSTATPSAAVPPTAPPAPGSPAEVPPAAPTGVPTTTP